MTEITVRDNEPIDPALKRFKRECVKAGIFKELKARRRFEKPSDTRRRKRKSAIRKAKRHELKMKRRMERY